MTKSENFLDWVLLFVRVVVGIILIAHGGQRIVHYLAGGYFQTSALALSSNLPFVCFAPLIEIVGGGLIAAGLIIELGTILVIPALFFVFFISHLNNCGFSPSSFKYMLNLIMLAITIGICGPGKWALWDPGKTLRKKIFE